MVVIDADFVGDLFLGDLLDELPDLFGRVEETKGPIRDIFFIE